MLVVQAHLNLLQEPLILSILHHKWVSFGAIQMILHLFLYIVYVVSQSLLIWLISDRKYWNQVQRASMVSY